MYIQYSHDKYLKNKHIYSGNIMYFAYILNIHTFYHLQASYISWKLVIHTKPTGKKHKMSRQSL